MPTQPETALQGQTPLDPDRFFAPDPGQRRVAREIYDSIAALPIVSPHGHVDPRLLADEGARSVLARHFPGMENSPQISMALTFTLEQMAGFVPDIFSKEKLEAIARDLAELGK